MDFFKSYLKWIEKHHLYYLILEKEREKMDEQSEGKPDNRQRGNEEEGQGFMCIMEQRTKGQVSDT